MKRCLAMLIVAALLLALAVAAVAEGEPIWLYVNRDSLKLYEGTSKDTRVVKKLKGGEQVRAQGFYGDWCGVYYTDNNGVEQVGFGQTKYLAGVMPEKYCKHQWPDWTVSVQPTCTDKGVKTRQCPVCGKVQTKELKKLGHSYGEWTVTEEPSCDAPGVKTRQCAMCGKVEEREIEMTPHEFDDWVVEQEATCSEPGLRWRECEECGFIEEEETELLEHTYGSWILLTEPTCTSTGERVRRCVVCGYRDVQVLDMLPHEFGAWTVTRQASCTAAGERVCTCVVCGLQQVEVIDPLPHDFGEWTVTVQPTCAQAGQRVCTCRMCGLEQSEPIAMLPHDFGWAITVEATDHSAGVRALRCANCGAVDHEESFDPDGTLRKGNKGDQVRALQQQLVDQGYLAAGGVDGSYGGGTERAIMRFQTDQGLAADGVAWPQTQQRLRHNYGPWSAVAELGRDADGVYERVCADCGRAEQMTIPAGKPIERRKRGEDVCVAQQMLNDLGYSAGTADGAYGPKLDAAYGAFAAESGLAFAEGQLTCENVDALVNEWIASVPDAKWRGQGDGTSPVQLVLTITTGDSNPDTAMLCDWQLTNMGGERCRVDAILLGFGEGHAFTANNLVMALDGTMLQRNGGNSASGSFGVSRLWGQGPMCVCAVATSEKTGEVWLSNVLVL